VTDLGFANIKVYDLALHVEASPQKRADSGTSTLLHVREPSSLYASTIHCNEGV
jgi:hypothetical protein